MKKLFFTALIITIVTFSGVAQQRSVQKATLIKTPVAFNKVPSIAQQVKEGKFIPASKIVKEVNAKRRGVNLAVPGKGFPKNGDPLLAKQKRAVQIKGAEPILTFESTSAYATPTDPTGAVGPNHYVNAWNSSFRIWDKEGNSLTAPASLANIFPGEDEGDPIVMYDQIADRFLITQFYSNGFLVAISQGPDPVNDGWYTYQFATSVFPDYPKYSIWSDGYYITSNKNSSTASTSEVVYALDRDKIIAGDQTAQMVGFPLPGIKTNGFFSPLGFNVNGTEMPPLGSAPIIYMQDDSWSGVSQDALLIWNIDVDWDNTSNSTISSPQSIATAPFDGLFDGGSFSNLPQPSGSDIDALQATIMYMAQYRRFATHNSAIINFVVDVDGSDDLAGIRWYELRQGNDGDDWVIYQEGTYAQPDGHSAFSGNMAMDAQGNIALAYTAVSGSLNPSLRYTGRLASDPLGQMTFAEQTIFDGTQNNPSYRYGDYSQMTVDPSDDLTFWSTGEVFTGGTRKNYVGAFKLASDFANDMGVVSIDAPVNGNLGETEQITITVRNFGTEKQGDIPVNYTINGGGVISEVINDSIDPGTSYQYTFIATADLSNVGEVYTIKAYTTLPLDEFAMNDTVETDVRVIPAIDLAVNSIIAPVSGVGLSASESVSVQLENFGAEELTNFDITYVIDGGAPVTEQVGQSLSYGDQVMFTFNTTADFSNIQDYTLTVATNLLNDAVMDNNFVSEVITNSLCQPLSNCSEATILGIELAELNNQSGCSESGYSNFVELNASLNRGSQNDFIITTTPGNVFVKVWVDFNDNFVYESNEVILNSLAASLPDAEQNIDTLTLLIPEDATMGEHLMRVKTNSATSVPSNPCQGTLYGETEDYKVIINPGVGISDNQLEPNDLVIANMGGKKYRAIFDAEQIQGTLDVRLHDINGRTLIFNRVQNNNGTYQFDFDMSFAAPGIYLLRFGNETFGKVHKFMVK
jgi:hypothetical protein